MVDLVFRNHTRERAFGPLFFKRVLSAAVRKSGLGKGRIEISVTLLGPVRMRAMNKRYRGVDAPTDVLSFPLNTGHRASGLAGSGMKRYNEIALGDIFICPSFALKNTQRDGFSPKGMLAWCTIHGFLHLAGYDHPDDGVSGPRLKRRGERMSALEKKILKALAHGPTLHHLRD